MRPEPNKDFDALLGLARSAQPPALDELEMRRLARAALVLAEQTEPVRHKRKVRWPSLMLAALPMLALVVLLGLYLHNTADRGTAIDVGRHDLALRVALRPGDVVIAAPGTALRIAAQERIERRVHIERGTALFDVVPLSAGQSFEVQTDHARLRVLGTVFSVEVAGGRTIVRVYEGRVFIAGRTLRAGQVWVSAGKPPNATDGAPLSAEAAQHAALRGEPSRPSNATLPFVMPQPLATSLDTPSPVPLGREGRAPASVYAEATRRLYGLGDAAGALGLLDAYDLDGENAALRERASVLRVDALLKLGRVSQAAEVARRYVLREPETHTSTRMRAIAAGLLAPVR